VLRRGGYGSAAIFQGNFNTRLYNKRDVLSFLIVNFLLFNSDVPLVYQKTGQETIRATVPQLLEKGVCLNSKMDMSDL
jgi:hypothetical protein